MIAFLAKKLHGGGKMKAKIWMVCLLALVLLPAVLAQADCSNPATEAEACSCIKDKITTIINLLTLVAGGVAVIAAIIVGIMFMNAGDPSEKDRMGGKLKALIVGIVIVALANPMVRLLFGSIMDCAAL